MSNSFKLPRRGQEQGRGERIANYTNWTGAQPVEHGVKTAPEVSKTFTPKKTDVGSLPEALVRNLRLLIGKGINKFVISSPERDVYEGMLALMTPEERSHVFFEWFDVPVPRRVVEVNDIEETQYEKARRVTLETNRAVAVQDNKRHDGGTQLESPMARAADDDPFVLDGEGAFDWIQKN